MSLARISRLVLATGAVAAMAAGIGTPVYADPPFNDPVHWKVSEGEDFAGVSTDRRYITVCDMERDGHGVHAEYYLKEKSPPPHSVGDGNGSAPPCGFHKTDKDISSFAVCEDDSFDGTYCKWEYLP